MKADAPRQTGFLYLSAPDFEHAFRQVVACDFSPGYAASQRYGKVAGTRGKVYHPPGGVTADCVYCCTAPQTVYAHGHGAVHEVVGSGYRVEHVAHLLGFAAWVAFVWIYVFGLDFHLFQIGQAVENISFDTAFEVGFGSGHEFFAGDVLV